MRAEDRCGQHYRLCFDVFEFFDAFQCIIDHLTRVTRRVSLGRQGKRAFGCGQFLGWHAMRTRCFCTDHGPMYDQPDPASLQTPLVIGRKSLPSTRGPGVSFPPLLRVLSHQSWRLNLHHPFLIPASYGFPIFWTNAQPVILHTCPEH